MASGKTETRCLVHGRQPILCKPFGKRKVQHHCLFEQMRIWLNECPTKHTSRICFERRHLTESLSEVFPTRLIDVGELDSSQHAHLVKFESWKHFNKSKIRSNFDGYAALSYCWGLNFDKSCLLREENEVEFQHRLPIKLPRTIQESIDVCRQLGIRYIWVDALCIIQGHDGNSRDWQKESSRVGSYYRNAVVTIAATWASQNDGGCLPVQWHTKTQNHIRTSMSIGVSLMSKEQLDPPASRLIRRDMRACILKRRGWALQELCMSTRLLWFTSTGVYWSCDATSRHSVWTCEWPFTLISRDVGRRIRWQMPQLPTNRHDKWYELMVHYSKMRLSVPSDKLPALSGLCKYVDPNTEDQYLAGIWKSSVLQGLAWHVGTPYAKLYSTSTNTEIPSWSFLSIGRHVEFKETLTFGALKLDTILPSAELGTAVVRLRYDDIHGEISSARLHLSAVSMQLYMRLSPDTDLLRCLDVFSNPRIEDGKLNFAFLESDYLSKSRLYFDEVPQLDLEKVAVIPALLLYVKPTYQPEYRQMVVLLLQSTGEPDVFTRIGLCTIELEGTMLEALDKEKLVRADFTLI